MREAVADHAEVLQAETYAEEGVAFARALGAEVGNQEHRLLLDLPDDLAPLRGTAPPAPGIEVRSWHGACPEDVLSILELPLS